MKRILWARRLDILDLRRFAWRYFKGDGDPILGLVKQVRSVYRNRLVINHSEIVPVFLEQKPSLEYYKLHPHCK